MCLDCKKGDDVDPTRRSILIGVPSVVIGAAAGARILGQQPPRRSLDDPRVIHSLIRFKSGADDVEGFLARPAAPGRHRAVVVTHGNAGLPEDIRNTAAQLARAGFVALAVNPTSRYPDMSTFPRESLKTNEFGVVMMDDIAAGIAHLRTLAFVKPGGVGMVGFCGGGIISVLFAALSREVDAVVAFYAAPFVGPENNTLADPRPHMLWFVRWVTAPIQAHFGTNDPYIPTAQAKRFEQEVHKHNPRGEVYFYEGAAHGFANYTNDTYDAAAARSAEGRMLKFLEENLK
jgi:carboxymethylenebutenolidase